MSFLTSLFGANRAGHSKHNAATTTTNTTAANPSLDAATNPLGATTQLSTKNTGLGGFITDLLGGAGAGSGSGSNFLGAWLGAAGGFLSMPAVIPQLAVGIGSSLTGGYLQGYPGQKTGNLMNAPTNAMGGAATNAMGGYANM